MNLRAFLLALAIAVLAAGAPYAQAQTARGGDPITLNFRDADIESVVGAFGHLLGRTFIVDPRVRGKITLETPRPVSRQQAYQMLQSMLRMQGFAVVETGNLSRVVPEADAKLQPGPVSATSAARAGGDQVVTQIFRLTHESASNLVNVLRPLISPNNTITAYPNNNSLVITDYAANVERLARIISSLDAPSTNEVEIVPIKSGLATDLAVLLGRMLDETARGGVPGAGAPGAVVDPGQRVTVLADPRTNSVLIRSSSPARISLARNLLMRLDQPTAQPGNINVVYLRNAEAARLAQVLRGVLAGDGSGGLGAFGGAGGTSTSSPFGAGSTAAGGLGGAFGGFGGATGSALGGAGGGAFGGAAGSATPTPATTPLQGGQPGTTGQTSFAAGGALVTADPATNSLIITAPEPVYRNLRAVIDRLDVRRAQVFIESLIVEVTAERAAEFGLQFQFLTSARANADTGGFGGTNFTQGGSGTNILGLAAGLGGAQTGTGVGATTGAGGLASIGQGLNLGVARGPLTIGSNTILNIPFLVRALETDARANILATPNLLTLDNEEARIIIGQNVPFITGSFTSGAVGGVNPFQTIERRDVGTTLRVRPQVSEAGAVRLQIFQEVSNVQDRTLQQGLITNRRAIESNVLVDDGQIIVLGGLIEERVEGGVNKVPGLGDLPIVGQLFRYDTRRRVKTNLLVFLRPVVMRTADATHSVTADRYDYVRQLQGDSRLPQHWLLPEFPPSPIPAMPAPPSAPPPSDGSRPGPASLSPDIQHSNRTTAPIRESQPLSPQGLQGLPDTPGTVRRAPNEVFVPLPQGSASDEPSARPGAAQPSQPGGPGAPGFPTAPGGAPGVPGAPSGPGGFMLDPGGTAPAAGTSSGMGAPMPGTGVSTSPAAPVMSPN